MIETVPYDERDYKPLFLLNHANLELKLNKSSDYFPFIDVK